MIDGCKRDVELLQKGRWPEVELFHFFFVHLGFLNSLETEALPGADFFEGRSWAEEKWFVRVSLVFEGMVRRTLAEMIKPDERLVF
jgi:hypothetical protein